MVSSPADYLRPELKRLEQKISQARSALNDPQLKTLAQEELKQLLRQKQTLENNLSGPKAGAASTLTRQFDSLILEIRPAAGGEEAKLWAEDLENMYLRFANQQKLKVSKLDQGILKIQGKRAYPLFRHEAGVHRVQRIPVTEAHGRIHTSTATVAVLPEIKASEITIDPKDIDLQFFRASTQGGQNVQKVSSAVRITHKPTGITTSCQTQRFQEQNRQIAMDMLRSKLYTLEQEKTHRQLDRTRQKAVGRGMRAEKIRTYNFPQNRVTDHRIKKSWKNLNRILEGHLLSLVQSLK
jgi:peptide chain release factor 1